MVHEIFGITYEVTVVTNLTSDHEEADRKLVALAHAANVPPGDTIMIRSP